MEQYGKCCQGHAENLGPRLRQSSNSIPYTYTIQKQNKKKPQKKKRNNKETTNTGVETYM